MIFSLALLPLFGISGLAVDTARLMSAQSMLQNEVDAAALNAAVDGDFSQSARHIAYMEQRLNADRTLRDAQVSGAWSGSDFQVTASGVVNTALVHVLPGLSNTVNISVSAVARVHQPMRQYETPEVTWLDPEAGDYNRLYVYCFNPDPGPDNTPAHERRSKRTPLQDNNGVNYLHRTEYDWPRCESGETISFELYNVRFSRNNPDRWERLNEQENVETAPRDPWCNQNHTRCRFRYFTDTALVGGLEHHQGLDGIDILETVICEDKDACSPGQGPVPRGRNRTPQRDTIGCAPGRYMYYGWEDRPPGQSGHAPDWTYEGWTDRDYDDIIITLQCPDYDDAAVRYVRLIE